MMINQHLIFVVCNVMFWAEGSVYIVGTVVGLLLEVLGPYLLVLVMGLDGPRSCNCYRIYNYPHECFQTSKRNTLLIHNHVQT